MKLKKLTFFIVAISTFLGLVSCKQNNGINEKSIIIDTKYSEAGILHNKGIEFVYNQLLIQTKTNSNIDISIENIIAQANIFLLNNDLNAVPNNKEFYDMRINFASTKSTDMFSESKLSEVEKSYLYELYLILENNENSLEQINEQIYQLECKILTEGKLDNVDPIMYACETSKYSIAYWNENLGKWIESFSDKNVTKTRGFWESLWKAVVKTALTDGTGAAVGAIAGGVGAVPAGLSASLVYCADKVIDEIDKI